MKRKVNVTLLKKVISKTSQGQAGFAIKAKIGVATVQKACSGICPSRIDTMEKFALAIGVGIDELFPEESENDTAA